MATETQLQVQQVLDFAGVRHIRPALPDTLFTNTGRRLYVIGDIDGRFRPRSNPYDLYAFGSPRPDDPLAGKLQGVWAQPVKGFSGYGFSLEVDGEVWELNAARRFTQTYAHAAFEFERAGLLAVRRDFAALDLPVLFTTLTVHNARERALSIRVIFRADFDLEDAWFTQLGAERNPGETVTVEEGLLTAQAQVLPGEWAAVVGCDRPPAAIRALAGSTGEMVFDLEVRPGAAQALTFAMVVVSQGGAVAARRLAQDALPRCAALLTEKEAQYRRVIAQGPVLHSPSTELNDAFRLAVANLQLLEAEAPTLGRYFYAGLEMFPFWFSNDGAYSGPGLLASGFRESFLNHVRIGLRYQEDGRVPHQVSPSGRLAFRGNAQETPLWVLSVWDAFRWTGDRAFLQEMYPGVVRGLLEYTLGKIDPDGDGYPSGPGMVEVEGMGEEKLDSAAYTWAALQALEEMAAALDDTPTRTRARAWMDKIEAGFEVDWWDETGGSYAMSLQSDNRRYPVPHWAVVTPLEVGLASAEHAAATFATLRAHYLNAWGLKHTAGTDERVWTLPTAALSRAAFRYGETGLGLEMLHHIAQTLEHGPIGLFHELIPEGACIVQLWSAAVLMRGVVEDMLGIAVRADRDEITVRPRIPASWDGARLENLTFGRRRVNVEIRRGGAVTVEDLPE